jgi:hypothetical protein
MRELEIEKISEWNYRAISIHCGIIVAAVLISWAIVSIWPAHCLEYKGGALTRQIDRESSSVAQPFLSFAVFLTLECFLGWISMYFAIRRGFINGSAEEFNQSVDALLMANQHLRGLGVIKDETESARLLQVAADGFKKAARESRAPGLCYKVAEVFFAEDRIKDERFAARCYLKAAMLGHPGAIDRLSERYAKPLLGTASVGAGNLPAYLDAAFVYSVLNVCAAQPTRGSVATDQRDLIAQRFGSSAGFDEKVAQLVSRRLLAELDEELLRSEGDEEGFSALGFLFTAVLGFAALGLYAIAFELLRKG